MHLAQPACLHPCLGQALVRRRVRAEHSGRDDIYQLRVPPAPIPVAWGRTVAPYVPAHLRSQREMAGVCGEE